MARPPSTSLGRKYFQHSHIILQNATKTLKKFALYIWEDELISISIFKKLFFLQGYWPTLETKALYGYMFRYGNPRGMICWTFYIAFVSCPLAAYFPEGNELIDTLEPIATLFVAVLVAFYAGSFLYFGDRFKQLVMALEEMRKRGRLHEEQPRRILKQTKMLSLLTMVYFGGCMIAGAMLVFGMLPQLIEQRKFHARSWYPYDSTASPYYEITLASWVAGMMSGACLITLVNGFLMANFVQAIGQFQLLNHNLKAMHTPGEKHRRGYRLQIERVMKQRRKNKTAKKKVGGFFQSGDVQLKIMIDRCAKHHQAILTYVGCINSAFNLILIQQYSCSVFPSLIAIILVTHSTEIDLKIMLISVMGVVCNLTLGLYSFMACKITEESELVRDSIFGCDWLAASDNFKRSMRLMICRSNQPSVVRVGGFITVSRESYWSVLKLIYTYYMAARATIKRISH